MYTIYTIYTKYTIYTVYTIYTICILYILCILCIPYIAVAGAGTSPARCNRIGLMRGIRRLAVIASNGTGVIILHS